MFNSFKKVKENSKPFSNMRLNRTDYAPWHKNDNIYSTVVRTIGIDPKDVGVCLENNVIKIYGSSILNGDCYHTNFEIPLSDVFLEKVKNVTHETKNGLTFIYVELN